MKTILIFASAILISVSISAQVNWVSTDEPVTGNTGDFYLIDSNAVNHESEKGMNAVWDYSGVFAYSGDLKEMSVEISGGSPYASNFTGAANRQLYHDKFQEYYTLSASQKSSYGIVFNEPGFGDIIITHSAHPVKSYPWTLNSSSQGNFSNASVIVPSTSQNFSATGTYKVVCDGFGSLTVGDSTIDSVLRTFYFDSLQADLGILGTMDVLRRQYEYHKPGSAFPLFFHSTVEVEASIITAGFTMVLSQMTPEIIYGIRESTKEFIGSIYPVPTFDDLNLELNDQTVIDEIRIINAEGKIVNTARPANTTNKITLSVQNLDTGMYLIQVISSNGIQSERFLKN